MTRFLLSLACVAGALLCLVHRSAAAELVWPGQGTVTFDAAASLDVVGRPAGAAGYALNVKPVGPAAAKLQITIGLTPPEKPVAAGKFTAILNRVLEEAKRGSVEQKVAPQPLPLAQGSGLFAELTDASLVGQPSRPNSSKVLRSGIGALDPHAMLIVTLQFDDPAAPEVADMMKLIGSLRLQRETKVSAPAKVASFQFTVPESKLRLELAAPGLELETNAAGTANPNPRYFAVQDLTHRVMFTGWFEAAAGYQGLKAFWAKESAMLEKRGFKLEQVEFGQVQDWEVIYYVQPISEKIRMQHLRAELVRDGTWIDLHLSATGEETAAELRQRVLAALALAKISVK